MCAPRFCGSVVLDGFQVELAAIFDPVKAQAEAVRLVSTAAETYFKDRAEIMRRLEVLNHTLAQNTKYILPAGSDLVAVLGLDGAAPVVPLKTAERGLERGAQSRSTSQSAQRQQQADAATAVQP